MPSCSSTWYSFSRSRRSRTRCWAALPRSGALQTTLLFLAVWWVWVYTSWITNWLDPELTPVRLLLFALMLGGLVLSTSIPKAFESRGLWFALAYAAMQVGRTIFLLAVDAARPDSGAHERGPHPGLAVDVGACSGSRAALRKGKSRLVLWAVALAIEYISPAVRFWIPKYGASSIDGLGRRRRPYGGALRRASSSSRSANPSS